MVVEKSKLNKLKKQLNGHMRRIAREIGVSHVTVVRALDGESENIDVLNKCIEYRDALANRNQQLADRI